MLLIQLDSPAQCVVQPIKSDLHIRVDGHGDAALWERRECRRMAWLSFWAWRRSPHHAWASRSRDAVIKNVIIDITRNFVASYLWLIEHLLVFTDRWLAQASNQLQRVEKRNPVSQCTVTHSIFTVVHGAAARCCVQRLGQAVTIRSKQLYVAERPRFTTRMCELAFIHACYT